METQTVRRQTLGSIAEKIVPGKHEEGTPISNLRGGVRPGQAS